MPNLDDELRRRMQRAGRRVDSDGLEARLNARRTHKQITQKVGCGFLALAVLAGSAVGVAELNRAFRGDTGPAEVQSGAGGTIAYMRQVRSCDGMTVDESSTDVVGLDLASGDLHLVRSTRLFTGGDRPLAERAPEFSPDGTTMAWADAYPYDLEVTDVETGRTRQLTHGLAVSAPHWSPDGTKLLFAAGERSNEPSPTFVKGPDAVYTMNPDGTDLRKLTDGTLPIWSPDDRIAFIRLGTASIARTSNDATTEFGPTSFYVMNADGTGLEKVYEAPGDVLIRDAEWSPDGTRIAAEATFQGSVDIFVVDMGLRTAIQLTDDPTQDTSPTWSPDGTTIAFQTGRWGDETSQYGEAGHSEIAVMNADGSGIRRLTNDCVDDYDPTWLRDDAVVMTLPITGQASSTEPPPTPDLPGTGN